MTMSRQATGTAAVGIMQPYFFPYIGYFQLMQAVDSWVVFDTPQYIRHGWVNRNRVLKQGNDDWKYVRIPVDKAPLNTPINQIRVSQTSNWRNELIQNLDLYAKEKAPYFDETVAFLEAATDCGSDNLTEVLVHCLQSSIDYLGISLRSFDVFSQMNLDIQDANHAGQWALRISQAIGAATYINPQGGQAIFEPSEFDEADIKLRFLQPDLAPYDQKRGEFLAGLSIIDCLMWMGKAETRNRLEDYTIVTAGHAA